MLHCRSDNACVVKARLVWGIAGMNRDGTDPSDSDDVGKAAYDDSFDLTRPETQQVRVYHSAAL